MKSKQYRTFEISGKKYRFDSNAFSEAICNYVSSKRKIDRTYNQHRCFLDMCELGLSYDAIKKWKQGYNGPGSIDIIEDLAKFLNVEYTSLLAPVENTEVNTTMNNNILTIYQECISAVYKWSEAVCGKKTYEQSLEPDKNFHENLNKVSDLIDKLSLALSKEETNKLHRIVNDLAELTDNFVPLRWYNIYGLQIPNCFYCVQYGYHTYVSKEDALSNLKEDGFFSPFCYIADEIDYAIELGYDEINEIDDDEKFDSLPLEEQMHYGYIGKSTTITPQMLFKSMFRQSLREIFKHDFELSN